MQHKQFAPVLDYNETLKLVKILNNKRSTKKAKKAARDKLVLHNLRLVEKQVGLYSGFSTERDDVFQAGVIGLIRGLDRIDPDRVGTLPTLVSLYIRQEITRHLTRTEYGTKFSNRSGPLAKHLRKCFQHLSVDGSPPGTQELVEHSKLPCCQNKNKYGKPNGRPLSLQEVRDLFYWVTASVYSVDVEESVVTNQQSLSYEDKSVLGLEQQEAIKTLPTEAQKPVLDYLGGVERGDHALGLCMLRHPSRRGLFYPS